MYEITTSTPFILEQKKSKFIGLLYNVKTIDEIKIILDKLNNEYKDATHICYAYKINEITKCFDDGEPNKTAGYKILEAINSSDLNYTLGAVIRYFGGVKLGVGPLSRCYFKVIKEAINESEIIEIDNKITIFLETKLDNLKLLNSITKDYEIINKLFDEKITYEIKINKNDLDTLKITLENTNIKIKES